MAQKKQKHIKKFSDGKEFFYLLASKENGSVLLTGFKTNRLNTIEKELENADIIQTFIRQGSKQEPNSRFGLPNEKIITQSNTNVLNPTKNNEIKQNIFTLAKQEKQAKEQAKLAKKQADSEFIAQREAQKQARIDKLLAAQRDSQGSTTLEARAKIKAEQMGEDIPYTRLSDTHIILDDITYPAEFVMIDKKDLKPSFEAGGFQTREVKQEGKIAQIRDNFDPLKIFGKVGEYDGLPLIARNGEIIAGNHRGEAIKNLSGENLARYNEYAKKVFGIDLPQDKIIVRRILDDTEASNGANLLEQIALAARSNKGAETTLGEQATSALGTYKDKIQKELLENPARRYIESDSVDNQMQAVANLLNAPLKAEEANLALLASLSKASHNLDIAKALDMIEGDDLLKAKIKNMLIANAGGFYNISRSIATPKLNEITNYLVDAIGYLGKASKQSGSENINRSEAYRELASKINDRASGKVQSFSTMETPLDEFVAQAKADVLGASLSKFANQDHASQRLYEALRDMPSILEEKFSTPSFDFFGNGGNKALKEVDMYDFLDYMIGRGQQNEATSQLKDALLELKKLESSNPPNNTPQSKPNQSTTPTSSVANNADNVKTPPPSAEGDKGGGLFDLPSQVKQTSKTKQTDFNSIKDKEQLQNLAQNLTFEKFAPLPQKVSLDEFLQESHTFDNVENFIKHLQTRQDAKAREAYLNLIEPTKQNPDLIINTGDKQEFIKAFEYERNGKKEIFNIVATKENGKIVLSALPTKKIDYIKNKIKNADSIEVKQGAIKDFTTPLENQSLTHEEIIPSSATKEAQNQTQNQNLQTTQADSKISPSSAEGDTGGGLFDTPSQTNQAQTKTIARNTIAEQNEMLKHKDFYQQYENGDIVFLDKSGKKHILETQVQDKWLETFGLESITQDFIPKIPSELKNALGKDIKLKMGSLYKLVAQGREEFIPQIKQVLESPEAALKDSDNTILLAKHLKDEDYFVNVSVDKDEAFISISNGIKEANNLKNKLEAGAEVIYQSPNANSNLQTLLQGSRYSPNKIDEGIIPNSTPKTQDPRELRHKELESSLDYRFENKFRKQAEQELGKDLGIDKIDNALMSKTITSREHSRLTKEINEDYAKWFDTQRAKGNKEILAYDKDLAEYRKLHNDLYKELIEAKRKNENKQAHLQWLDSYKHQMTNKTDEEIIATEIKKPKSTSKGKKEYFTYDEGKASLEELRKRLEKGFDLHPLSEFGTNYAEFYQDGKGAIAKLIAEANAAKQAGKDFSGQVAGAFSKEIDGAEASIDLVWGKITNAQTHEGYGLAHIIDKHPEITPQMLDEIIAQGKVESKNGVYTIWYKKDDDIFKVGISQGFKGEGSNKWIITAYQSTREKDKTFGDTLFTAKQPLTNSSDEIIPQNNIRESLNDTLKEAFDIFKAHNKDEANDRLFDRVIEVASKLDVRYWEQVNPKWVNGTYTFWLNRAMVDTKLLKSNPQKATQTILHELIHGVTSRAIYAYDNGLRELLTKTQIDGITELKSLYNEVRKNNATKAWIKQGNPKDEIAQNEGKIYGLANEHEFLAELANKSFRDFLKGQNLFTRIIEAVAKIFGYVKKSDDEVATNALKEAKEVLYKIMDNHKEGFTRDFDDAYKKIDFIDFDNYKKYLAKHSERVKNHSKKKDIYLETLAKGGNGRGVTIGEAVFSRTLGVKSLDELENTPLTQALKQIINGEGINTFYSHLGAFAKKIKKENDKKIAHNLTIITGLQGFIKSGLYKELDDTYASYLLENLTNIANKDLKYRGKAINDFFAKDFADREIERLRTGNLDSLGIMPNQKTTKGQENMKLDKFLDSNGKMSVEALRKYAVNMPEVKFDSTASFKAHFKEAKGRFGFIQTPYKVVKVNMPYAYAHFYKNTSKANRGAIKSAFFETFSDPLFIAKDNSKGRESVYFYKPFLDKDGNLLDLFGIGIDSEGKIDFMTFYKDISGSRMKRMLKIDDERIVYVKE